MVKKDDGLSHLCVSIPKFIFVRQVRTCICPQKDNRLQISVVLSTMIRIAYSILLTCENLCVNIIQDIEISPGCVCLRG